MSDREPRKPNLTEIWDDQLLVKAYNNSINLAQEELAKRISMQTNTQTPNPQTPLLEEKQQKQQQGKLGDNEENNSAAMTVNALWAKWQIGDFVRATYDDGIDYEAKIISINEKTETCRIRYYGYGNEQDVRIADLVPSWGKAARQQQLFNSQCDPKSVGYAVGGEEDGTESNGDKQDEDDLPSSTKPAGATPFPHPPKPPMPPNLMHMSGVSREENQHLQALIMSWYISGYYTGLYQGLRAEKAKHKK